MMLFCSARLPLHLNVQFRTAAHKFRPVFKQLGLWAYDSIESPEHSIRVGCEEYGGRFTILAEFKCEGRGGGAE